MTTTSMDHQLTSKNYSECYEPSDVWTDLLIVGGLVLTKLLPTLLDCASNMIEQIMSNGYAIHVRKGDFELHFGKDESVPKRVEVNGKSAGMRFQEGRSTNPTERQSRGI